MSQLILYTEGAYIGPFVSAMAPDAQEYMRIFNRTVPLSDLKPGGLIRLADTRLSKDDMAVLILRNGGDMLANHDRADFAIGHKMTY
ncbi:hypothetical protein Daus18300_011327 [Diaporthe australafricana]|uniref:Uncharacterized protein n=1 Tax=Diaporthe australafricana TaxID=127596 RepID=A0ABR3W6Z4_9PEZI